MRAADETVEGTLSYDRGGEYGMPGFRRPIDGNYHGTRTIAPVDKLVEILSLRLGKLINGKIVAESMVQCLPVPVHLGTVNYRENFYPKVVIYCEN